METGVFFLAVAVLCAVITCVVMCIKKDKRKTLICLGAGVLLMLCGVVKWTSVRTLANPKYADEVTEILVYSGSTGNCAEVTEKEEIAKLYKAFCETKVKNTFDMTVGHKYHIVVLAGDRTLYDFCIKSEENGKSGVLTGYEVVEGDGGYTYLETLLTADAPDFHSEKETSESIKTDGTVPMETDEASLINIEIQKEILDAVQEEIPSHLEAMIDNPEGFGIEVNDWTQLAVGTPVAVFKVSDDYQTVEVDRYFVPVFEGNQIAAVFLLACAEDGSYGLSSANAISPRLQTLIEAQGKVLTWTKLHWVDG